MVHQYQDYFVRMKHSIQSYMLSAVSIALVCLFLALREDWDRQKGSYLTKLMGFTPEGDFYFSTSSRDDSSSNGPIDPDQSESKNLLSEIEEFEWEESAFHDLPKNVQRYLHRAFMFTGEREILWEDRIKVLRSVEFEEEGTMLLKGKWWCPFTAVQHFSASPLHPGFVHIVSLKLPSPSPFASMLTVDLRKSLLNGNEYKSARVMKVFPVLDGLGLSDPKSEPLLLWLSASPLFPTSLLPRIEGVKWSKEQYTLSPNIEQAKSSSIAKVSNPEFTEAELHFSDDGLIASVFAHATKSHDDSEIKSLHECRFYDYELIHGMMIPTRAEFGWRQNGEFQPYYTTKYKNFNYTYFT